MTARAGSAIKLSVAVPVGVAILALMLLIANAMRAFLVDDAFIGLHYVQNLLAGKGFVFNAGEQVEGVTNIGWLLLLAGLGHIGSVLTSADILPGLAKTVGLLCAVGAVGITYAIACRYFDGQDRALMLATPVALLAATHWDFLFYSLCGMETGLLALLLCIMAYFSLLDRWPVLVAVLGAVAFAVRPECVLIYPLLWLLARGKGRGKTAAILPLVVFIVLIAVITGARFVCFGDVVPNTFHAKPTTGAGVLDHLRNSLNGISVNVGLPFNGLLVLPVIIYGALRMGRKFPGTAAGLIATFAVGWLFATYAVVDWTKTARYFAPFVPMAFLVLWVGIVESTRKLFERYLHEERLQLVFIGYALVLLLMQVPTLGVRLSPAYVETYPGYVMTGKNLVAPSLWMRDNLPPDAVIATRRIGVVGYYSERRIFDYKFGLIHKSVARIVQNEGRLLKTPLEPVLREVWRQTAPDYLLEDDDTIDEIIEETGGTAERFEVHGLSFRVMKTFPIGTQRQWTLCEKLAEDVPDSG